MTNTLELIQFIVGMLFLSSLIIIAIIVEFRLLNKYINNENAMKVFKTKEITKRVLYISKVLKRNKVIYLDTKIIDQLKPIFMDEITILKNTENSEK